MKPTEDTTAVETDGGTEDVMAFEPTEEVTATQRYREFAYEAFVVPARVAWQDWRMKLGILIMFFYFTLALIAVVSSSDWGAFSSITLVEMPSANQFGGIEMNNQGPFQSLEYPLGTDQLGRDIFAMLVHATPNMLIMTFSGGVYVVVVATIVGSVTGYKGGAVDTVLMTISDVVMTIPGLPLVIVLAAIFDPSNPWLLGPLLVIGWWAGLARTIRAQVLTIREHSYVEASRTMGISTPRIIQKDILPNLMPYIMVNFVMSARQVIFNGVGLYFLGILVHGSSADNWGVSMQFAYQQGALWSMDHAYKLFFPMMAIVLLSFGLILFSQGTDRLFNPRVRTRGEGASAEDDAGDDTSGGVIV